jgi:hypothetical protein
MSQSGVDRSDRDPQADAAPQKATKSEPKATANPTGRELSDTELDGVAGAGGLARGDTDP